jgi:hypothetical protein
MDDLVRMDGPSAQGARTTASGARRHRGRGGPGAMTYQYESTRGAWESRGVPGVDRGTARQAPTRAGKRTSEPSWRDGLMCSSRW